MNPTTESEGQDDRVVADGLLRRLALGTGTAFVLQGSGAGIKFLLQVVLARWLGSVEYGGYSYAVSWAQTIAAISGLGFTTSTLRFLPEYAVREQWPLLRGYLARARQWPLLVSACLALFTAFVLSILSSPGVNMHVVVLGLLLAPPLALMNVQSSLIRSFQRIALALGPVLVAVPLLVLAVAMGFRGVSGILLSSDVIFAMLAVVGLVVVFQAAVILRVAPPKTRTISPMHDRRRWLQVSMPLWFASVSLLVLNYADILMLGGIRGQEVAGIYNAASRTAMLVSFVLTAASAIIAPMIGELHARQDQRQLQRLLTVAARWTFWPSVLFAIVLVALAPHVLSLFGPAFVRGRDALIVLVVGQVINAGAGPVGYLLSLTGFQGVAARVYASSALVNILLNGVLIPRYGLVGAALGTAVAMAMWNVLLCRVAWRRLGLVTIAFPMFFQRG